MKSYAKLIIVAGLLGASAACGPVSWDEEARGPAAKSEAAKLRFLDGIDYGSTTLTQVNFMLGHPDAVLLLKQDDHPRAAEWREMTAGDDATVKKVFWYNEGCQPMTMTLNDADKVTGADYSFYKMGCMEGLDTQLNLPPEFACTAPDRAPHCG